MPKDMQQFREDELSENDPLVSNLITEVELLDFSSFAYDAQKIPQDLGVKSDEEASLHSASSSDSALGISINDSGVVVEDASTKGEYKIFYQSLEYPRHFTKELVNQFNFLKDGNYALKSAIKATHPYHQNVAKWLDERFNLHNADIVIIAEYYDLRETSQSLDYNIVGKVGKTTRAMTVYCTTKQKIEGCRITTLDGETIKIHHIDEEYAKIRGKDVTIEGTRARLEQLSVHATEHIGQGIEVMIYNRYMLFAHIKGMGDDARENLIKALSPNYIDKIDDTTSTIKYVVAGDLNANIKNIKQHTIEVSYNMMQLCANTDASHISGHEIEGPQQRMNIPGKSSSGDVCHDGIYIPLMKSDRTKCSIKGSLWPIVANTEGKYEILGDHKGFLLEVSLTHSGRDTPTNPFTPPATSTSNEKVFFPNEQSIVDNSIDLSLKEGEESAPEKASSEDEGVDRTLDVAVKESNKNIFSICRGDPRQDSTTTRDEVVDRAYTNIEDDRQRLYMCDIIGYEDEDYNWW